jgi:hypothetical protein
MSTSARNPSLVLPTPSSTEQRYHHGSTYQTYRDLASILRQSSRQHRSHHEGQHRISSFEPTSLQAQVSCDTLCPREMTDASSAIVNPLSSTIDVQDDQDQDVKPNITGLDSIRLEATCKTLELFLSMLSPITRDLVFASLTFEQCRDLLTFTERYECEALIPSMRSYLIHTTIKPGLPTALFIFASDRDDWAMGRDAMSRMDAKEMWPILGTHSTSGESAEERTHAFLDRLRPEWRHILIPVLFFGILRTRGTQLLSMDWGTCSDQFVKRAQAPKRKGS